MAVILCHSPKGGTGTTSLAAQLSLALADLGKDVTIASAAGMDSLPLHFGLPPAQRLPAFFAPPDEAVVAQGIDLRNCARAAQAQSLLSTLKDVGLLEPSDDHVLVLDIPASNLQLAGELTAVADLHLCPLSATPDCLALLPEIFDGLERHRAERTAFVFVNIDETRRLARNAAGFARELLGPRLIGRIRHDESVPEAMAMLQVLSRYAPASAALADARALAETVAARLSGARQAGEAIRGERNPNESRAA